MRIYLDDQHNYISSFSLNANSLTIVLNQPGIFLWLHLILCTLWLLSCLDSSFWSVKSRISWQIYKYLPHVSPPPFSTLNNLSIRICCLKMTFMSLLSIVDYLIFIFFLGNFSPVEYLINWEFFCLVFSITRSISSSIVISLFLEYPSLFSNAATFNSSYFLYWRFLKSCKSPVSFFSILNLLSLHTNLLKLRLASFLLFFPFISVITLE